MDRLTSPHIANPLSTMDDREGMGDSEYDDDYVWPKVNTRTSSALCVISIVGSYVIIREVWASHQQSGLNLPGRRGGRNGKGLPLLRVLLSLRIKIQQPDPHRKIQ